MMNGEFEIGYLVQLLSGGPVMTVCSVDESSVSCSWFGRGDVAQEAYFPKAALRLAEVVRLQGVSTKWHAENKLEPVGVDHDGQVKPVGLIEVDLVDTDVKAIVDSVTGQFLKFKLPDQTEPPIVEEPPLPPCGPLPRGGYF